MKTSYILTITFILCLFNNTVLVNSYTASAAQSHFYNNNGELLTISNSLNGTLEYEYDRNGNVIKKKKSPNMLLNSNFSIITENNGIADDWVKEVWSSTASNFEMVTDSFGRKVQKITGTGIANNGMVAISQVIKVEPNMKFNVSGRFNIEQLTNAKVQLYVDFSDATSYIGSNITESNTPTNGGYMTLSNSGIIPSNAIYARIYAIVRGTAEGGSGTMYVDSMNMRYE